MVKHITPPQLFPQIIKAVSHLKNPKTDTIVSYIHDKNPNIHNTTQQVKKALKYAIDNDVIKQRLGRFYLNNRSLCQVCEERDFSPTDSDKPRRSQRLAKKKRHLVPTEENFSENERSRSRCRKQENINFRRRKSKLAGKVAFNANDGKEEEQNNEEMKNDEDSDKESETDEEDGDSSLSDTDSPHPRKRAKKVMKQRKRGTSKTIGKQVNELDEEHNNNKDCINEESFLGVECGSRNCLCSGKSNNFDKIE